MYKGFSIIFATNPSNSQDIIGQTLLTPCRNFIQQRLSNPAISSMVVEFAKQQNDVSTLVQYAEIDIVFLNCMQLIGDYNDIQNLSNGASNANGALNAGGGPASGPPPNQSTSVVSPSLQSTPQSQTQSPTVPSVNQATALPSVSPTTTIT